MAVTPRPERLAPEVFRLPVERIRDGYYSDAYFNLHQGRCSSTRAATRACSMQVFQRKESMLGGIDEAIACCKQCAGRRAERRQWVDGWDALEVRALHEGDAIAPWETVMTIEGDYALFAHLETVYLGCLARRTLVMRNVARRRRGRARQADPVLPRPPRPLARADRRRLGGARRGRDRRVDRRAGLVVGRPRRRHRPARADRRLRRRHGRGRAGVRRPLRAAR